MSIVNKAEAHLILFHWFRMVPHKYIKQFKGIETRIFKYLAFNIQNGSENSTTNIQNRQLFLSITDNVSHSTFEYTTNSIKGSRILILGEADFSYTLAFVRKRLANGIKFPPRYIVATELREHKALAALYQNFSRNVRILKDRFRVDVICGVDATRLSYHFGKNQTFCKIYFNCPHGESMNPYSGEIGDKIIAPFFKSARKHQKIGDKIYLTIPQPQNVNQQTNNPEQKGTHVQLIQGFGYKLYTSSKISQYKFIQKRRFGSQRYPGYRHCQTKSDTSAKIATDMRQFIFEKCDKNNRINYTKNDARYLRKERKYKKGSKPKKVFYVLPEYSTDDDSSDYE